MITAACRAASVRPPDVPGARGSRRRCLNHRQVRLDQRLTGPGLGAHPRLRGVTGLVVLLLGRLRGDVDPGRHPGRGEPDGARRRRTGAAGDGRATAPTTVAVSPVGAGEHPSTADKPARDDYRAPQQGPMTAPAHAVNLCNTGCRDGALRILRVLSALTRRRLPDPFALELSRCLCR